jgi:hypothetical protein
MYGEGKGGKPFFVHELHFPTQQLQQYLKMYHALQCTHFTQATEQMDTQIIDGMITFTS